MDQSINLPLRLLAEDKRTITYRPTFARMVGSVTGAILLQQALFWWMERGRNAFYKFKEPCSAELYRAGDSWCEELSFSRREFDTALHIIGTKSTKGAKKSDLMGYPWPTLPEEQTSPEYAQLWQDAIRHLVIYWTDKKHLTWYFINEALLVSAMELTYLGKSGLRRYLDKGGKWIYLDKAGLRLYQEKAESGFISLDSEITTEITTESLAQASDDAAQARIQELEQQALKQAEELIAAQKRIKELEAKSAKEKRDTVPAAQMTPMKNAIAAAFGWQWATMTGSEKGQIQAAAKQLCLAQATPADVAGLYRYCQKKFDQFGPAALVNHLSNYRKEQGGNHASKSQGSNKPREELEVAGVNYATD